MQLKTTDAHGLKRGKNLLRNNGHGFGLHSSANAARQMNGALSVQSQGVGHGACFTFELPLKPK